MAGIKSLRKIQLGAEATKGLAVPATTIWRGTGTLLDKRETNFVEEDVGVLTNPVRSYAGRLGGEIELEPIEASFEQIGYLFEGGVKKVGSGVQDGAGDAYIYDYPLSLEAANDFQTFTVEGGDNEGAEEMEYSFVREFTLEGAAGEALMMSGILEGRQVQPTTFTPAIAIPSPVETILFSRGRLYIDNSGGAIGTTLKSNTFLAMTLSVTTGIRAVFTGDGELYFTFAKMGPSSGTLEITFEHDTTSVAEKAAWRDNLTRLVRMEFPGSAFTNPGDTHNNKLLRIDLAGQWESFDRLDEQDGNDIVTGTLRIGYYPDDALYGVFTVVNGLTALP